MLSAGESSVVDESVGDDESLLLFVDESDPVDDASGAGGDEVVESDVQAISPAIATQAANAPAPSVLRIAVRYHAAPGTGLVGIAQ